MMKLLINKMNDEKKKVENMIKEDETQQYVSNNIKIRSTSENNSFTIGRETVKNIVPDSITININSSEITETNCYNNYMIKLDNNIDILKDISIKNIFINKNDKDIITEKNNTLKIKVGDDETNEFEFDTNYYNRYEIVKILNEAFNQNNVEIECFINDDIFSFTSKNVFTMFNDENSILPSLGFCKSLYTNNDNYIAENTLELGDNIFYLVIENISVKPLFKINIDLEELTKLQDITQQIDVDYFIIKFYKTPNNIVPNNSTYSFFFEEANEIILELN